MSVIAGEEASAFDDTPASTSATARWSTDAHYGASIACAAPGSTIGSPGVGSNRRSCTYSPARRASPSRTRCFRLGGSDTRCGRIAAGAGGDQQAKRLCFPRQIVQLEYSSESGYSVNDFVSRKVPDLLGWPRARGLRRGATTSGMFSTESLCARRRREAPDSTRARQNDDRFYTLSLCPAVPLHVRPHEAGGYLLRATRRRGRHTLSKVVLDDLNTGRHLRSGFHGDRHLFAGKNKSQPPGVKINHYSNAAISSRRTRA